MSVESAKKLVARVKDDEALARKFKAAGESGFEALATQQGLACTVGEMRAAIKEARATTQLSDKDLEKVAGAAGVAVFTVAVI